MKLQNRRIKAIKNAARLAKKDKSQKDIYAITKAGLMIAKLPYIDLPFLKFKNEVIDELNLMCQRIKDFEEEKMLINKFKRVKKLSGEKNES